MLAILISQIDSVLARVKEYVKMQHGTLEADTRHLDFNVYGRGTAELFIVGEALASTQDIATGIAMAARFATIVSSMSFAYQSKS